MVETFHNGPYHDGKGTRIVADTLKLLCQSYGLEKPV